MRRPLALLFGFLLALLGVLVLPQSASAAPLPATYTGSAGGDIFGLDTDLGAVNLAGVRVGISRSTVDTDADPEVTARASNLAGTIAGLGLTVVNRTQTAPPDNDAAQADTIAAATVPGVFDSGALTTRVEAHYTGDDACVAGGLLADSRISTTGVTVGGAGATNVARTGDARTQGVVELVPEPAGSPLHRAVRSTASGTTSGTSFLNGAVAVQVAGTPTLEATATGDPGGASVTYTPGNVTVTAGGNTTTVNVGATQTFTVPGGEVQITANPATQTEAANGRTATGSVTVVTAQVRVGTAANPVSNSTVDLLPLSATATAPAGGIDCPPPAPTLTTPADGSTTTDTTPTFTGTAEPNSEVEIFVDGDSIGTTTADADGNFTFTPTDPLPFGQRSAVARATVNDATSADSNTNDFTITPPAPTLTTPADGSTTEDTTPTFTGTTEPNSEVEIFVDGDSIGTTTADADGNFTFTPTDPLPFGQRSAVARATVNDATSADSNTNDFTITPPAPTLTTPADGSTTTDTTPTFTGTTEPGATVQIRVDGNRIGTTTADDQGNFSFTPKKPLRVGDRSAVARATVNGATSDDSNTNNFEIVDNTAPDAPTLDTPADGSTTNDTTPPFTGTAEPGSSVEVFVDGTSIGTTTADDDGNYRVTPTTPLAEGPHQANAVATDDSGNDSQPSNTNNFTVDATAPAAPTLATPPDGSTTTDSTPPFTGTAEPGSSVEVFVDGTSIGTTTAGDDGTYSLTPKRPLDDGPHRAYAVATDGAGNESARSNVNGFRVQAPTTPVITSPVDGSITDDQTPPITGTADPGTTVTIVIDGEEAGTTTTDADGNFTFTPAEPLDPGVHDVTAFATDANGNDSDLADPVVFLVDDGGSNGGGPNGGGPNGGGPNGGGPVAPVLDTIARLANTGGPGVWVGLLAALGLAGGATTLFVSRRRRSVTR